MIVNRNKMRFCIDCRDKRPYRVSKEQIRISVRGIEFECDEYSANCLMCGAPMYVPEINDKNVNIRTVAYKRAREGR